MKALEVKNVSIAYMTGDFRNIGLKEFFVRKMKGDYEVQKFWADKNINFNLEKGDMLGIVGTNGAGKSTLLKAVTGIMVPTEGKVKAHGRIAALLELASGFDGELTVRENTYLRGALLGYTREFMDEKYDEIIEFAELEDFQERMFKQLSSGMKSRLGFSIASLIDPDIIILDEVLSVGDGAFRKKSHDRMREILDRGVTGILVSHSVSQVRDLCNKVLWLDHGNQVAFGKTRTICDAYEVFLALPKKERRVPESMEEIEDQSRRFNLYIKMSERERVDNPGDEMLMSETVIDRQKRWLRRIDAMDEKEREALYKDYSIGGF
ncbi:MAG: ABC transporter ATP-binding protein [Eubacterium sp.]|nr:ABC transporter ATP-binding protein [Eubacterium sp.]